MNQFKEYSKRALRTASEGPLLETTKTLDILESRLRQALEDAESDQATSETRQVARQVRALLVLLRQASHRDEHMVGVMYDALGLAGEAGEAADYIKKWVGHGKQFDPDHLKRELGDVLWYINRMATRLTSSLFEVAMMNLSKLRRRYPSGFSHEASENRQEETE